MNGNGGRDREVVNVHELLAGLDVPDLDPAIDAGAGELGAVGAEIERGDGALVSFEIAHQLAAGGVPELDDLVAARRGDELAVGAELHGVTGDDVRRACAAPCRCRRPSTRTLRSALAETRRWPSGLKLAFQTGPSWPANSRDCMTMSKSQSRIVKSVLAEASWLPAGLKARARMSPLCPLKVPAGAPVSGSNRRITPSLPAVKIVLLSLAVEDRRVANIRRGRQGARGGADLQLQVGLRQIVELDAIAAAAGQRRVVRADGDAVQGAGGVLLGPEGRPGRIVDHGRILEQANLAIAGADDQQRAVLVEAERADGEAKVRDGSQQLAVGDLVDAQVVVVLVVLRGLARDQVLAVGAEGERHEVAALAGDGPHFLAVVGVHSLMSGSEPPEAINSLSGLKATAHTTSVCPVSVAIS